MSLPLNPGYLMSRAGGLVMARSVFLVPSQIDNIEGGAGDTTRRFTAMTYQQTSKQDPHGDLFRLINAHGRAKGGIKAFFTGFSGEVMSSNPQTTTVDSFNLSGKTLKLVVDGGVEQTITFPTGTVSGVTWTAATARNVADHVSKNINGAQCLEFCDGEFNRVLIRSDSFGPQSRIAITGGTGAGDLGFTNEASAVTAASTITLANTTNRVFPLSGATPVTAISPSGWAADDVIMLRVAAGVTLKNSGVAASTTFGSSGPMLLKDNVDCVTTQESWITLKYQKDLSASGDSKYYWRELSRSDGVTGLVDLGQGVTGREVAWIVAHQAPNNLDSAAWHNHISIETTDTKGEAQTRLGIYYGRDTSIVMVTSAQFMVHGNQLIISGDDTSTKDIWFSTDNTGQKKARRASLRMDTLANNHNFLFQVHDDAGNATKIMAMDRTAKALLMSGALQLKRNTSNTASASTLTLDSAKGNIHPVTGTTVINYITTTNWQSGAEIDLAFTSTPKIVHNAGSVPANTASILLRHSVDWTPDAGANIKLRYNGTNWIEVARATYVGARSSVLKLLNPTGLTSVNWSAVPNVESVIDTAVHMPVDLTGASQFRLSMVLGSTVPTVAMKFRVLHVATGNMSAATDISANSNYAVLGATGSEITLTVGAGGIYVGPWETIDEAAKTTARALVFSGRNGASAAQNFKNVCVEYR